MTDTRDWIDLLERREQQAEVDALVATTTANATLSPPEGSDREVGPTLAAARRSAGLTRDELALRMGCDAATLGRLEDSEHRDHSLAMLRRAASALGMELRIGFAPRS